MSKLIANLQNNVKTTIISRIAKSMLKPQE